MIRLALLFALLVACGGVRGGFDVSPEGDVTAQVRWDGKLFGFPLGIELQLVNRSDGLAGGVCVGLRGYPTQCGKWTRAGPELGPATTPMPRADS